MKYPTWDRPLKDDSEETINKITKGKNDGWLKWLVCQKGHTDITSLDTRVADWTCPKCEQLVKEWGLIDNRNDGYDTDRFFPAQYRVKRSWLEAHPDESDVIHFDEGDIISHKDCGGLGVVCTFPEVQFEPAETYVTWVIIPDWTKPTNDVCPQSVWLGRRIDSFVRGFPREL
jgi:hypothetical protein